MKEVKERERLEGSKDEKGGKRMCLVFTAFVLILRDGEIKSLEERRILFFNNFLHSFHPSFCPFYFPSYLTLHCIDSRSSFSANLNRLAISLSLYDDALTSQEFFCKPCSVCLAYVPFLSTSLSIGSFLIFSVGCPLHPPLPFIPWFVFRVFLSNIWNAEQWRREQIRTEYESEGWGKGKHVKEEERKQRKRKMKVDRNCTETLGGRELRMKVLLE